MKRQIVLDWGARLNWFDLESGTNVGEHRGAKGKALGVMLLPSLIFCSEIECARVLQVRGEDDGFVAGFSRKLHTKIPGIKGNKNEIKILGSQVLGSKRIESRDGVSKGTRVSNMLPSQRR